MLTLIVLAFSLSTMGEIVQFVSIQELREVFRFCLTALRQGWDSRLDDIVNFRVVY
jgi:hypothetical protein